MLYCVSRLSAEKALSEARDELTSEAHARSSEAVAAARRIDDLKTRVDVLNHQLTQAEGERSQVDVDNKRLKRRLEDAERDLASARDKVRNSRNEF